MRDAPVLVPHICRSKQMWESSALVSRAVKNRRLVPHICRSKQMWEYGEFIQQPPSFLGVTVSPAITPEAPAVKPL